MNAEASRRRLPPGVVWVFWVFAIAGYVPFLRKEPSELKVYVTAAERMAADERIHRPEDDKPFTYPPFFAIPFLPFAILPKEPWFQRTIWYVANLGVLWWLIRFVERRIRLEATDERPALFWVLALVLTGRHLSSVFENQSHDLLVLFAVALGLDAAVSHRITASGFLVGAGAAMKATPLLFFPYFLWKRRWLAAAAVVLVFAVLSLLPELFFQSDTGRTYLEDWYHAFLAGMDPSDPGAPATASRPGVWRAWNPLNQSLSGTIYRFFTPAPPRDGHVDVAIATLSPGTIKLVTYAAMAPLLALFLFVTRPVRPPEEERERRLRLCGEFGLFLCGMVLFSPMSSKSHFCVLLIGQAFLVAHVVRRRDAISVAMLAAIAALSILTTRDALGRDIGNAVLACGPVTWVALLTALAIARVLQSSRPGRIPHGVAAGDANSFSSRVPETETFSKRIRTGRATKVFSSESEIPENVLQSFQSATVGSSCAPPRTYSHWTMRRPSRVTQSQ
ncbi:MAG: DUF2029 domain-containing protein [Acidobacteriota bacterium]|nr:DUF2029 domain-containing protein [Acidobacteriota bacterium]MDQ5871671.1 DUF2029 domain-containing protein [Acidobacteriota bacterium]